ncbi:porin [Paraburkholderia ginsengiterrae]|uniref:Porin n=1 Tax=Paraburkholderia ginsengiterrae TaxID=1462993 RepID=A0A1A9N2R8_9BURK|nr:porin [Paraburkholderia ginsengiterrae]OAJ53041.1 porin [Paraburkholderia ginsengiterrae]OAJ55738.1 porin [Paraburkholderia ginsengiterrae]
MNKKVLAAATLALFGTAAHAQSSVTLYGLIDAGFTYVNHAGANAQHLYQYGDGVSQGSRFGLRGSEDLGGGLKAIFTLENGFNSGTGTLGQGGALFGRQAFVGLTQNGIGSLTFGRQYSFSTDYLGGSYANGGQTVAGNYAYHINDIDQLTSSRINNSVKFSSANFAGLTFGAMYGFSNQAGAFAGGPTGSATASSSAYSFGLNYANGPFGIGAAYTDIRYPGSAAPAFSTTLANSSITGIAKDLSTVGVGTKYSIGPATMYALWTHTNIEQITGHMTTFNAYEAGGKYAFTPALTGALGYTYMQAKDLTNGHWNQIDASVDYNLSKRTDVYLLGIYQDASGKTSKGADLQAQIGSSASSYLPAAGASTQLAVRVGLRHKF